MPDAVACRIGNRLRQARWARGMTQAQVARPLGVSFQTVQKYERGEGLSAAQLVRLAGVLGASPATLLECGAEPLWSRDAIEVAAAYMRLPPRTRATVRELMCQLADGTANDEPAVM